jgi:ribonucleoside-triphosphate reductase
MRNLEVIERDLTEAREALSSVEGTPAEVYSRIVGYYRSVRNWNRGKREEYGERQLYRINELRAAVSSRPVPTEDSLLLLFIRASCPACPPAKAAARKLGIPVELVNADTAEGMAEAARRNVMSTPTAILISPGGEELARAGNAETIGRLLAVAS